MGKTGASLLGVTIGLATLGSAQALPAVVADPSAALHVASAAAEQPDGTAGIVQLAQYYYGYGRPYYAPYRPPYGYYHRYGFYHRPYGYYHHFYPHYRHYGFYRRY